MSYAAKYTPEEKFLNAALLEYSKRSLYNFVKLLWNSIETMPFEDAPHIKLICDKLQKRFIIWKRDNAVKIDRTDYTDLLFNLPPGSSKSRIISIFFPAWVWLIRPDVKFITYSYSYTVAEDLSHKCLNLMQAEEYQRMITWHFKSTAVSFIQNTKGGSRFVTSTGGTITGMHADIIIGDDPNSPRAINSASQRETEKRFITEVLPSRKTSIKKSYNITVQQRLHPEDVTGVILDKFKLIDHISIPAIDESGNSFCSRFPIEYLEEQKERMGSVAFAAQYLQRCLESDGGIIKVKWLKFDDLEYKPNELIWFLDTAYGLDKGDFNALVGVKKLENKLYICYANQNKLQFPDLIDFIKLTVPRNCKLYIEGKASGKSIIQTLKSNSSINIVDMIPTKGKIERKNSVSPFFESGRIIINSNIECVELLKEQLIFDNTKNDDLLDVIMYSIEKTLQNSSGHYGMV